jgi:hypothetical protein
MIFAMTTFLILTAAVVVLFMVLQPAHRHFGDTFRPGDDLRDDADYRRTVSELRWRYQSRAGSA